jgi:hypothetical protein
VQAVRAFQAAAGDFSGGETPENELSQEQSSPQPTVDLPTEVILRVLPDAVLAAPREALLQQIPSGSKVSFPLMTVLPMLPSGRVEFAVQEVSVRGIERTNLQPAFV